MQYGLLQRTLAVAIEILIASDLLDVLHLHDFDAITFLHLSILMQETSKVDAIATSHQNDFDAITLLHLSILMQETTDGRCNSELSHRSQQTDATRQASRAIASARIKHEIDAVPNYHNNFGPITSKICQCNRVKN